MSYASVSAHSNMAFDKLRNREYLNAMGKSIDSSSVVLDLGAGIGVLGLLAAQCGAKRVYSVEPETVIHLAEVIARANSLNDRVHYLKGVIEEIELPEPVDMILSVFTGNFLLEEDLLPSLFFARDHYLKPGGVMLPSRGRMRAVIANAPALYEKAFAPWSDYNGLDFRAARRYVANTLIYDSASLAQAAFLAEPQTLLDLDFYTCKDPSCQVEVKFSVKEPGLCHGVVGWFDMQLEDTWLSTSPHEERMHWNAVMLPLEPPLQLEKDDEVMFRLARPVYGEWSWWVTVGSTTQQHSTAFSAPFNRDTLIKQDKYYKPMLAQRGQAWRALLEKFDGSTTLEEITDYLLTTYPSIFRTHAQASQVLKNFVKQCT